MNERGRTSGSFLIAVGVVVLAVGGYFAWLYLRPDPYALSERVVRDARRSMAYEVREFQRSLDDVVRDAKKHNTDVGAAIDAAVGLGLHPDFETAIAAMTRIKDTFEPDHKTHTLYDELYSRVYKKMYSYLKPLYEELYGLLGNQNRS
jgi:hypothetical protein